MRRGRGGRLRGDQLVSMIALQVNGKRVELEAPTPLLTYLDRLGVNPRAVAVEHNGEIIERSAYDSVTFQNGDIVEIVRMVGGGQTSNSNSSPFMGRWRTARRALRRRGRPRLKLLPTCGEVAHCPQGTATEGPTWISPFRTTGPQNPPAPER